MWLWGSPCQRPCFSAPSRQDDAHVHHTTALVLYAKASYVCMYVCMCGQCFNVVAYKIQKLQKLGHILFVLERYLPSSLLSVSSYLYPHIHFILVQFFSGPKFPLNYHLFFFCFCFCFPLSYAVIPSSGREALAPAPGAIEQEALHIHLSIISA